MDIDIREFGAVGDGYTDNTVAIQKAIDYCEEQQGGRVHIPKGIFITGMLTMKSHVTIHLHEQAELLGSSEEEKYPEPSHIFVDAVNSKKGYTLIYGKSIEHAGITGEGTINGRGRNLKDSKRQFLLRFVDCKHMLVENVLLKNAGSWCAHFLDCEHVHIKGLNIINKDGRLPNLDGIDIDSCRHFIIEDSIIDTFDDSICLKSTLNKPCTHVVIKGCQISSCCAGFKIGTESMADFKDIEVKDSLFYDCELCAIKIIPVDGGHVEHIHIHNNKFINCTGPVLIATGKRQRTYNGEVAREVVSHVKDILIEDAIMTCKYGMRDKPFSGQGVVVSGRPDSIIENIRFKNLDISFASGREEGMLPALEVPLLDEQYPECYELGVLPTYGFFFRYCKDIQVKSCMVSKVHEDSREAVVQEKVDNIIFEGIDFK